MVFLRLNFMSVRLRKIRSKFDFVFANLTADVIIPLLPLLVEKCNKMLVLSGILGEQESWVLGELKKLEIENGKVKMDGEWISIVVEISNSYYAL